MSKDSDRNNIGDGVKRPTARGLHPGVYVVLIGLALWFVLWVWSFIGSGETDHLLFIVSGFMIVVVALQLILSCVGRRAETANADAAEPGNNKPPAFRDWARGDFDTEDGRVSGAEAAILILRRSQRPQSA